VLADPLLALAPLLRCPNCGASLQAAPPVLRCAAGHSFDLARDGHVSLLSPRGKAPAGDPAAMVAARAAFLGAGHYDPIAHAVAAAAGPARGVVDLGAGTGHYLAAVLERAPEAWGLALDASRPALRRAVRAHPRIAAVACDVWRELPVQDGAADVVLNVFAPRNGAQIARVLAPGGRLVVVTPTPRHLRELVEPLGLVGMDPDKPARLAAELAGHLRPHTRHELEFALTLGHADLEALVGMGPSAHHVDAAAARARIAALPDPASVTASVRVATFSRA
jgi:23S rRNA (guanine745-N1)-methyltransferase